MEKMFVQEDDIAFIVKDIIMYKLGLDEGQLVDSADLQDDLGVDSLDIIELRMELEKKLGIIITDEEGEKLNTIGQIVDFIRFKKL
jgi:acyl carrier protein